MHVALLRGINLGSRRLPMKDLAAMLGDAGCADVRTYIQSGNVVYRAVPVLARRVPGIVEKAIAERYGFECPVVTRSAAEIDGVIEANPFPEAAAEPKTLHVGFLRDRPAKSRVAALDPDRSPPDAFVVRGREIYVYYPKGSARSKLTPQYFDPRLETLSTFRNWRTVLTLQEMLR
jgi:uncharacterized protein (DUF1697 family)